MIWDQAPPPPRRAGAYSNALEDPITVNNCAMKTRKLTLQAGRSIGHKRWSILGRKEERQRVKACGGVWNALKNNWRGLEGTVAMIVLLGMFHDTKKASSRLMLGIWLMMAAIMAILPMPVGGCALLPVFCVPMCGILSTSKVCSALTNENISLFFLGGWLLLLLNNCGLDKRLVCGFLAKGVNSNTPAKLLLKSCFAAFCVSAIAERNLTTEAIIKYVVAALEPLKGVKNEVNFEALTKILCNAIAISSFLGSMCIVHASINTIQMRSLFCEAADQSTELPDVFNYLNYSAYAIPTCLVMFLLNIGYEVLLISKVAGKKPMSARSKESLHRSFRKNKDDLGPMSTHEKLSLGFLVLLLVSFFTRWSKWLSWGWATFRQYPTSSDLCALKDASTAALFVVVLHFLPKSLHFFKIFTIKKHKDLPKMKVESGILFWKFVDTKTDYSLFILLGAGAIIYKGMVVTKLNEDMHYFIGQKITDMNWNVGILIVVLVSVVLGSLMPGLGAQACVMPLWLGIAMAGGGKWPQRQYLVALAVGLGTGLGFSNPAQHSPSYFVPRLGKVGRKNQILYSLASQVICALILWLSLCFYAPLLWDPDDQGIIPQVLPGMPNATAAGPTPAPEAAAPPPTPGGL